MDAEDRALALLELIEDKLAELAGLQAEIRDLIKNLHGTTRDARTARRDLLDAIGKYDGDVYQHFTNLVISASADLEKTVRRSDDYLTMRLTGLNNAMNAKLTQILGIKTTGELLDIVTCDIREKVMAVILEEIRHERSVSRQSRKHP